MSNTVECYAQRLLNPFRGAMHTIRYAHAEAATLDGVQWDIYVANEQLLEDLQVSRWTQVSDIRYGKWTAEAGLKRGPIYPSDDFRRMEEMGTMVYQYLTCVYQQVPFKFADAFELWLLDEAGNPLALLDSALTEGSLDLEQSIQWRAGLAAQEQFSSASLQAIGVDPAVGAGEYLTRYINTRAGKVPAAQWFHRQADGSGNGLAGIHLDPALQGRRLEAGWFPMLMLAEAAGNDAAHRQLIDDFHAWQAPWLLMLPHLDSATRQRLERQARDHASAVFKLYRLYPAVVDEMALKAALVEAVMLRSQANQQGGQDDMLPTYYIELAYNPGPVD